MIRHLSNANLKLYSLKVSANRAHGNNEYPVPNNQFLVILWIVTFCPISVTDSTFDLGSKNQSSNLWLGIKDNSNGQ